MLLLDFKPKLKKSPKQETNPIPDALPITEDNLTPTENKTTTNAKDTSEEPKTSFFAKALAKIKLTSSENFVVTIGDFGSIVALHKGEKIIKSLFLKNLDEEAIPTLKALFAKHKSPPIAILIDNLDQTYKKKTYPMVSMNGLRNIAKREMLSDGDNKNFKNFIPFIPKKSSGAKRSECLYISASRSELIEHWLKILLELPNRVTGVYALPVESFRLFQILKDKKPKANTSHQVLDCMIVHNKVSGTRQIVYSDRGIVFTRIVNYDFTKENWAESYEQDVYSTFEYLKRSFPAIKISGLRLTNIFGAQQLEQINALKNTELVFYNLTPCEAAKKAGYDNLLSSQEICCDLLMSKVFSREKKRLKFTTETITNLEKLSLIIHCSHALNATLIAVLCYCLSSIALFSGETKSLIQKAKQLRIDNTEDLNSVRRKATEESSYENDNNPQNIERIIDFGKVNETLTNSSNDFIDHYSQLSFLRENNTQLTSFRFSLSKFEHTQPNLKTNYTIALSGVMKNPDGDIDDLFKNFDALSNITKKSFENYNVQYTEIPRSIDFTKKYHEYPIEFTISNKQ